MIEKLKQRIKDFLIWSQKYTETDMIYLAKGGFWLTLGQIISTVASFLLAIAFANLLPKETYGNYKYILSLVGILGIFSLTGMGTATTQAVARGLEGSFYSGFKEKLKFGILGSIAALGLATYYFFKGNYTLPIPLLISAIFLPLWQASGIYGNFLNGKKLFNYLVSWGTISQLISIFSLIVTLFLTKNLFWLIAVYFISGTFSTYFFYLLTQKKFQPNKKEDPKTLSFGKHLSLIDIFSQIAFYLDRILIFHYLGAAEVAIYSFAITPPEHIKGLLKNIQPLALPKFAEKDGKEIKKTIFKKMAKLFLFLLPVVILYILIAPILYRIFFPKYLTSVFYSQIFSISILSQPIFFLGIIILQSQKAQRQLYQLNIFTSIIQIILLFFGVYFYGIFGAILARVISRFIGTGLSLWSIRKT
jgi:O-antigen/teichoic acid export membrane protein